MFIELLFALLTLYLLLAAALAVYIAYRISHPPWHKPRPGAPVHDSSSIPLSWSGALTPSALGLPSESVSVPTDSGTLSAWLVRAKQGSPARTAVACVHGAGRDRRAFLRHAAFLARAGYDVLLLDCHNHGLSDTVLGRPAVSFGECESRDVAASTAFLRERGALRVVVFGTSQGAAAALLAAATGASVDLLLLENPFVSPTRLVRGIIKVVLTRVPIPGYSCLLHSSVEWLTLWFTGNVPEEAQMSAERFVGEVEIPMFFVHGTADIVVDYRQSEELFRKVAHRRKELWLVEDAAHTHCHFKEPKLFEEKVLAFIAKYLGETPLRDPQLVAFDGS